MIYTFTEKQMIESLHVNLYQLCYSKPGILEWVPKDARNDKGGDANG